MQAATYVKMQTTHKMPVLAQGAGETGMAEAYMCSRIMRDPLVRQGIAEYQGEFEAEETDGGFTRGTQWLVWKFESDSTLGDAMQVRACVCTYACMPRNAGYECCSWSGLLLYLEQKCQGTALGLSLLFGKGCFSYHWQRA